MPANLDPLLAGVKALAIGGVVQQPGASVAIVLNASTGTSLLYNVATGQWDLSAPANPALLSGNASNPVGLPFFSPVSTAKLISATGDNLNGGGQLLASNRTGSSDKQTRGVAFYVTDAGHHCSGVRFFWVGDPTWETLTNLQCELWEYVGGTILASTTLMGVGMNLDVTAAFSPVALVPGRPYAVSVTDLGDSGVHSLAQGYTLFNATGNVNYAVSNIIGGGSVQVQGSPWLIFAGPSFGSGGGSALWAGMNAGSTNSHACPKTGGNNFNVIEPVVS